MSRTNLIVTDCKNDGLGNLVDGILATSEPWVEFL